MSSDSYTFDGFILVSQQQLDHVRKAYYKDMLVVNCFLICMQVPSFCFQQYGYNYCMKLEPMRESTAVCSERAMHPNIVYSSHYYVQMFTVMDALMLEEYFFNHLFQLYDFTHGIIIYSIPHRNHFMYITVSAIVLKCLNGRILFVPRFSKSGELLLCHLRIVTLE